MAGNPLTPDRSGFGMLGGGDPFLSLHPDMNRLFDDMLRGTGSPALPGQSRTGAGMGGFVNMQMNVSETDSQIRITMERPAVPEQDIDVSLDDVLTIRGDKRFERNDDKENFHLVERSFGRDHPGRSSRGSLSGPSRTMRPAGLRHERVSPVSARLQFCPPFRRSAALHRLHTRGF